MDVDKVITDVVPTKVIDKTVDNTIKEIVENAVDINDDEQMKQIIRMFNQNIAKKNMNRIVKFNNLLDQIGDVAYERIATNPGLIEDKDVIAYIKAFQDVLDKSRNTVNTIQELPPITLTQNNNTLVVNNGDATEQFSPEARQRILDMVKLYTSNINTDDKGDLDDK